MAEIIQASTPDQIEHARALFNEYAASLSFSLCFEGFTEELAALPGAYSPPQGRLLLAYDNGEPVGCIAMRPIAPATCEMKRLYVKPSQRRTGTGRLLVQRLLAEATAAGYTHMRLDSTHDMKAAHALYGALGFYRIERYNDECPHHAIWMEIALHTAAANPQPVAR